MNCLERSERGRWYIVAYRDTYSRASVDRGIRSYERRCELDHERQLEEAENMICMNCARLTSAGVCFSCTEKDVLDEEGLVEPDLEFYCSNFKWKEREV